MNLPAALILYGMILSILAVMVTWEWRRYRDRQQMKTWDALHARLGGSDTRQ